MIKPSSLILPSMLTMLLYACGGGGSDAMNSSNENGESNSISSNNQTPIDPTTTNSPIAQADQAGDLRLPVNFWVITSSDVTSVSYDVSDQELDTYLNRANKIWAAADIEFFIHKIERLEMTREAAIEFQDFVALDRGDRDRTTAPRVANSSNQLQLTETEFNVVLMKEIGPSGATAFIESKVIYIAESNLRGEVRRPSILAHELGHALSLRHVLTPGSQCNLMTTGDCGSFNTQFTSDNVLVKTLHPCQVDIAREQALRGFTNATLASSISCVEATR